MKNLINNKYFRLLIILIATTVLYHDILLYDFADLDEDQYLRYNMDVQNFSYQSIQNFFTTQHTGHYLPATLLVYMFSFRLWGMDTFYFHLLCLVLHIINICLVYALINRLTKRLTTAVITALLFAVHPLQIESFAWIVSVSTQLFTFFYLICLVTYLKYLESGRKAVWLCFCFILMLFSVLSKSFGMTIPAVLLLFLIDKERTFELKKSLHLLPFILLSFAAVTVAFVFVRSAGNLGASENGITFIDKLFLVPYAFFFYIGKVFFPSGLIPLHFNPEKVNGFMPFYIYLSPAFFILIYAMLRLTKKFRIYIFRGLAFYSVTIFICLPFFAVGDTYAAEKYAYLPSVGIYYIIAAAFS
ncbi:MAG: glycosyltransferase family 39 protein, partial [Bacteroidetes bacterium]|nr:glycosyltransferase family 39 protein [Bacteroidota bacterium]